MAKLTLIKNISEFKPSIANIVATTILGDLNIGPYDPDKTYESGDKIYVIEDGQLIIKECIGNNVTDLDDSNWSQIEGILGSNSGDQRPNSYQKISHFETKLAADINTLTKKLNTLTNLHEDDLKNTYIIPLFDESEITLSAGRYEFGRIFI